MILSRRALLTRLAFSASTEERDTHTLICVFLRGGADTMNMWVPYADDAYYRQRPTLAIKRPGQSTEASIRLTDHYALHPAMRPLEAAFREGRLAAVQAVGTDNTSGSHFECQDQMEHGDQAGETEAGGGWLGRFLRERKSGTASPLSAIAIGKVLPESLRGAPSVSVLDHLDDIAIQVPSGETTAMVAALQSLYGADVTLLGQRGRETLDLFKRVSALRGSGHQPEHGADYGEHEFASGLREIAHLIKARVGLEVACIDLGGWDTHFFQGAATGSQADRIRILAQGLAALDADLTRHRSRYTVLITTEFGRRIYENASLGTDHGRGFALMALGDRVHGGQVIGPWPTVALDESNPLGPGGIEPALDYRSIFAEILTGAMDHPATSIPAIFPGLNAKSLGLMKS